MIREFREEDKEELLRIHNQYFKNEFSFDDFFAASMCRFVVTDDENSSIITAGSIRPIAEMIAITNLEQSPKLRRAALYDMLQVATYVLRNTEMRQLHAFVQDSKWETHLIKAGFKRCIGNPVYLNL